MRYQTLDGIVRSALMQRGYPIHWYVQALKSASDCLRELTFDCLQNVNTVRLPVSATGAVNLPCDFVDHVKIGFEVGPYVKPLVQKKGINRIQDVDANGLPINYDSVDATTLTDYVSGYNYGYNWRIDGYSDNGQPIGRVYGFNAGWIQDGFQVLRERGQIQLDQNTGLDSVYLEYISDGQCPDNATKVHPYAQKTIEAYIFWQFKEHSRAYGEQERRTAQNEFSSQRRILRARVFGLGAEDIKRIVRSSFSATIKG